MEIAHLLGEEIAKSDEIKNLEAAKAAFDKDADLQAKMSEYETERVLLAQEFSKETSDIDELAVANLKARLEELSKIITSNPIYIAFAEAQRSTQAVFTALFIPTLCSCQMLVFSQPR